MSTVNRLINRYVSLYIMLDLMLAGEHRNDGLRRSFAQQGKAFLDEHETLAAAPYSNDPESDYALLQACPELRKQVARVLSAFEVNAKVADMIPGAKAHSGHEMDKVTELLNSPERLKMLRLVRNPAMAELAANATVRGMMDKAGQGDVLTKLDRLNTGDARKPSVDELGLETRIDLVRKAIAAPEENQGFFSGVFKSAAAALAPRSLIERINNMAEDSYKKAQADLDKALSSRVPQGNGPAPKTPGQG